MNQAEDLEDYQYYIARDKWEAERQAYIDYILEHAPYLGEKNEIYGFSLNIHGQNDIKRILCNVREALNDLEKMVDLKVEENEKNEKSNMIYL